MLPLLQKLPIDENSSFIARTYKTPDFETPWHQHQEIELVLCNGSHGTVFIGNYIGDYAPGEVYLLGSNLPHWYRKKNEKMIGSALVVQFREEIFGSALLDLPEFQQIKNLLERSKKGLKLQGELNTKVKRLINTLEKQKGFEQFRTLLDCLHLISTSNEYELLTQYYFQSSSQENQERIGVIYEYSMKHFKANITLQQMADLTNQSVSNFCKYFKQNTKKTYINFLNEIRIGHASKLLQSTDKAITEICYESGFRNWANFSNHFKRIKGVSPKEYRKAYNTADQ